MAIKTVQAKVAGIRGDNQQYREAGVIFDLDLADGEELPFWVEDLTPPPPP